MTTENKPPQGTPEWLRTEARRLEAPATSGSVFLAVTMAAGLRAAAERIESLERKIKTEEDWWEEMHDYKPRAERAEAEMVNLRASVANYIRKCAELSDECEELKRVQDALKREVAAANKGARVNALVNESLVAKERDLRAENEALRADKERLDWLDRAWFSNLRDSIDAARKEGA